MLVYNLKIMKLSCPSKLALKHIPKGVEVAEQFRE